MNTTSTPTKRHSNNNESKRVLNIKTWLESLDNEEKRKIVSALKRAKDASENLKGTKLRKAQETYGALTTLSPILLKSERFGKERFALEFLPKSKLQELETSQEQVDWLSPEEAHDLANSITIERATYPQRLKLAFIYLARRQGVKNYRSYRYSTDGEHYTKAYPSLETVAHGEETIGFEEALNTILKDDKTREKNGNIEVTNPEVFQTKVFRVSLSSLESSELLAFEKCQPDESVIPRANYRVEVHPPRSYRNLNRSNNYKLIWPIKQENALFCLMDACQDLILQCSAQTLGDGENFYATLYQREAEMGPEGFLYKGLVTNGPDKKTSSQKATEAIASIWQGFAGKAKPLMCLHSKECHWICQLVEES